ncbi:tetratricopeptide repeat protein [Pseudoxanthomonas mexicana]|uniref:tetratricopeptide repeat protein n=1 Tax=Pseudoxanthomonas mexicana TaxID=128785 RepID=UPI000781FF3E|nr:tetratricopeptide repeat protein [Pseudoxanthomonas mexicana]
MSPLLLLSFALQIACCVHVVRTGRPLYWVFILLVFSFLAVIIYFIAEILPDLRHNPSARRTVRNLRNRIDPERDRRDAAKLLKASDTPENRRRLAEESLRSGDYAQAAELYEHALKGLYATDPDLMLGLAKAQFGLGDAQKARTTLDALIAANPGFRSADGHLLYARAVEDSGDLASALHEYETVAQGYPGEEARVRYALLLRRDGQFARARDVLQDVLDRSDAAPKYYQREQRDWIEAARRELAVLPQA